MFFQRLSLALVVVFVGATVPLRGPRGASVNSALCEKDRRECFWYKQMDQDLYCRHFIIRRHCKVMCGLCKDDPALLDARECKHDHSMCGLYVNKDYYCPQQWMQENCCNYCKSTFVKTAAAVSSGSRSGSRYASRASYSSGASAASFTVAANYKPRCTKRDLPVCVQYMQNGKDHYCSHKVIRKHCKKSCGLCEGEYYTHNRPVIQHFRVVLARPRCLTNDVSSCGWYIQQNKEHYCKQNFLLVNCRRSCGLC